MNLHYIKRDELCLLVLSCDLKEGDLIIQTNQEEIKFDPYYPKINEFKKKLLVSNKSINEAIKKDDQEMAVSILDTYSLYLGVENELLIDQDLSVRLYNILRSEDFNKLGDITKQSEKKFFSLKTKGFGRKTKHEVKELLLLKGLSFKKK